jgi:hypothetical protein
MKKPSVVLLSDQRSKQAQKIRAQLLIETGSYEQISVTVSRTGQVEVTVDIALAKEKGHGRTLPLNQTISQNIAAANAGRILRPPIPRKRRRHHPVRYYM